jgi:hypothetical protein
MGRTIFTWWASEQFFNVLVGKNGSEVVVFRPREWRGVDDSGSGNQAEVSLNPQKMAEELGNYPPGGGPHAWLQPMFRMPSDWGGGGAPGSPLCSPTTSRARFDGIRRKCFILPMVPILAWWSPGHVVESVGGCTCTTEVLFSSRWSACWACVFPAPRTIPPGARPRTRTLGPVMAQAATTARTARPREPVVMVPASS